MHPLHLLWQGAESSSTSLPGSEQHFINHFVNHFINPSCFWGAGSHGHDGTFFTPTFHLDFLLPLAVIPVRWGISLPSARSGLQEQWLEIMLIAKMLKSEAAVEQFPHCSHPPASQAPCPMFVTANIDNFDCYLTAWLCFGKECLASCWVPANCMGSKAFAVAFCPLQLEGQGQIITQQNCSLLLCSDLFVPQLEIAFM